MHMIQGGCHCGNISYIAKFQNEPSSYTPRVCDCKLCSSHGATYAADNNGILSIKIKNKNDVSKYKQGSRIAEFLICKICGVMIGVCYEENDSTYGAINIRSAHDYRAFGKSHPTHLTQLTDEDRIKRWKKLWFSNVKIEYEV